MRKISLYNSLSNRVEPLNPLRPGEVSMYVCGPTVYQFIHIGNTRPVVVFDVLKRVLTEIGYKVTHISNITDVDDKIITAAKVEGITEKELTTKYAQAYFDSLSQLHAIPPTFVPYVTENIGPIVEFIGELIQNGFAYEIHGDVYFRVSRISDYGKLANLKVDDLKVGARIEENKDKENPLDFALWKKTDQGIRWPSPWSEGRPGWHTECVVMIQQVYPDGRIDIHGGGFDLRFPHHENEIAQSEALHHHPIASIWMHNGFINIDNEKMSKSLGNVRLAKDLLGSYGGNVLRYIMLTTHYRAPVNFTDTIVLNAQNELQKMLSPLRQASIRLQRMAFTQEVGLSQGAFDAFLDALCNDLNTPNAITVIYNTLKDLNQSLRLNDPVALKSNLLTLQKMLDTLGLEFVPPHLMNEDLALFSAWEKAKADKAYTTADSLRQTLIEKNLL